MERKIGLIGSFAFDWIRYSEYVFKDDENGNTYVVPREDAGFTMYNPFDVAEELLIDCLKIGEASKGKGENADDLVKGMVLLFAKKYGLLGLISASTYNRDIIDDERILLIKNNFLKLQQKTIETVSYLRFFTPFVEEDDISLRWDRRGIHVQKAEDSPKFLVSGRW